MADVTTTSKQLILDLTLARGSETKTRRLTFDNYDNTLPITYKPFLVGNLVPSLTGGLSTFIQPSGWRDYDQSEDEYTCTAVEAKVVSKTETVMDLSDE